MSKDFEKAYKELAESEVPDLWNRIEAGLTEKSAPDKGSVITDRSIEDERINTAKKRNKVTLFIKRYSSLAAAILCLVIIVPALILMKRSETGKSASDMAAAEVAFDAAGEIAETTEESAETTEETAEATEDSAGNAEEPAGMREESAAETDRDAEKETSGTAGAAAETEVLEAETAACESAADEAGNSRKENETGKIFDNTAEKASGGAQPAERKEDKAEDALQDNEKKKMEEGQILTNVIVKVVEADDYILEARTGEEMGTLYTAVVQEEPSGFLTEGEEIVIFIPVYSSLALIKDCKVELDLAFCEKENYSFTVEGYHEQKEE